MRRLRLTGAVLLLGSMTVMAQGQFESGIRGGATFTHGYATIPPISTIDGTIPQLNNKNNGVGNGYTFGLWGRRHFNRFFLQIELNYNDFLLKQRTDLSVPAEVAFRIARLPRPSQLPAQTPTNISIISESTLRSVTIPILLGRKWAGGKVRVFAGPNLLFTTKADVSRNTSASIGGSTISIPTTTTDLKNPDLQNPTESALAVKRVTYAAEVGVGYTFFRRLDLDTRYAAPVGGIYKNNAIRGYLGIATISLGLRLF